MQSLHRLSSLVGAVFMTFLLFGCGQPNTAGSSTTDLSNGGTPIHLQLAAYRAEVTTPEGMCTVPLIVDGTVSGYKPGHWNTSDGARPATLTEDVAQKQGFMIFTPLQTGNFRILYDLRKTSSHEYAMMGGQAGKDTYSIEDYPRPALNQRYIMLFVPSTRVGQSTLFLDVLVLYQVFPVDAQGNVTLEHTSVEQGNTYGQTVTIPLTTLESKLAVCPK